MPQGTWRASEAGRLSAQIAAFPRFLVGATCPSLSPPLSAQKVLRLLASSLVACDIPSGDNRNVVRVSRQTVHRQRDVRCQIDIGPAKPLPGISGVTEVPLTASGPLREAPATDARPRDPPGNGGCGCPAAAEMRISATPWFLPWFLALFCGKHTKALGFLVSLW